MRSRATGNATCTSISCDGINRAFHAVGDDLGKGKAAGSSKSSSTWARRSSSARRAALAELSSARNNRRNETGPPDEHEGLLVTRHEAQDAAAGGPFDDLFTDGRRMARSSNLRSTAALRG